MGAQVGGSRFQEDHKSRAAKMLKNSLISLFAVRVAGTSHEDITYSELQTESRGKKIFVDMYADW